MKTLIKKAINHSALFKGNFVNSANTTGIHTNSVNVGVRKVKNLMLQSFILTAAMAAGLAGCDSGSSGGSTTATPVAEVLTGRFVDASVVGLGYKATSHSGATNDSGEFSYRSGENVTFNVGNIVLGSTGGKSLVTPFDMSSNEDVVNAIASLLQSLDDDNTDGVIRLSATKVAALNALIAELNLGTLPEVDVPTTLATLDAAVVSVAGADYVAPDAALVAMLSDLAQFDYMNRNISKTPEETSDKAGIEIMGTPVAARSAAGDLVSDLGNVKPIISSYWDASDAYIAVSHDNGASWKRTNLSRNAKAKAPSMHVEGDYVLVSWISTDCQGGPEFVDAGTIPASVENPAKAILANETDPALHYTAGSDTEVVDLFQVLGNQGSVDYSAIYPEVGVVPYHCVWSARGVLDVDGALGASISGITEDTTGQFIWFKSQQMTSGTRDAKLNWPAGLEGFGFGLVWQEDPEGLMPGEGEGPGVGWSGAKTHHKTNIWYSYIKWDDFAVADTTLDAETGRPKSLLTMSVPIPVSDNNSCNVDQTTAKLMCTTDAFCSAQATVDTSGGDDTATFCVVDYDGNATAYEPDVDAVLDGDTAASRPNLHFAAELDVDGVTVIGARALVMYEESKGLCELGKGCKDSTFYPYDVGKWILYHHMPDFADPLVLHKGDVISSPVQTASTNPLDDTATFIPLPDDPATAFDESALYENTRRERFVVNADPTHDTKFVMIYKQGWYNQGERADIFMRRAVGGYDISNMEEDICVSCVTPASIGVDDDDGTLTAKVESWTWDASNLNDESWTNPYDDARSLRASLEGDRLLIGYAWTPNWQLATNPGSTGTFKDSYDFFVRRSFDSGASFTDTAGVPEKPRNTSYLVNNKENVVEPRIATIDGTSIDCPDVGGFFTGGACSQVGGGLTDPQLAQFFVVTYCTAANVEREPIGGIPVHAPGLDCYYSWTIDNGDSYIAPPKDVEVVDESGSTVTIQVPDFECLACSEQEEVEPEVVLSEGSSFADTLYAADHQDVIAEMHGAWVANGIEDPNTGSEVQNGSDAWYGLFELKLDPITP